MLTIAVTPPATPTPLDEIATALDEVGPLHGLPIEDRIWLARNGQEAVANPGDILFEEGAPAEHMVVLLKGEIHVRRQRGGAISLFVARTAQLTGLLPFSRMKSYGGQGFAVSPVWALLIPSSLFPAMLAAIPSMTQRVVSTMLDRVREVTRIEEQAEKLSALGKLAGNLAHELNNPASAAQRAAFSLVQALRDNRTNRIKLVNLCLTAEQFHAVEAWEEKMVSRPAISRGAHPLPDAASFLAVEDSLRAWLGAHGCEGAAEIAPPLAEQGVTAADLDEFRAIVGSREACISLQYFSRYLRSSRAADALLHSTARIFDLIEAIKDYSNLDRAPILEVDVVAGLEATLQMFSSRMKRVKVERDYEPGLQRIPAYGGELNQVWTALIENALDALGNGVSADRPSSVGHGNGVPADRPSSVGHGNGVSADRTSSVGGGDRNCLRLACRVEGEMMLVEIWDTGPGIPQELKERIFEPFFTTKPPGTALGLGLDNAMRIVRKHRGHIGVDSEPGSTCFRVRLPLDQLQAY